MAHAPSATTSSRVFIDMRRIAEDPYMVRVGLHDSPQVGRQQEHLVLQQPN